MIGALADVMVIKGVPEHIRSDNGPEFVAKDFRKWLAEVPVFTAATERRTRTQSSVFLIRITNATVSCQIVVIKPSWRQDA